MSAYHIEYTSHSINKEWKKRVNESKTLTSEQKKKLINDARKDVFLSNLGQVGWVIVQIIGFILCSFFVMWILSLFQK